jgi:mono/diheme cytochrome c family protein
VSGLAAATLLATSLLAGVLAVRPAVAAEKTLELPQDGVALKASPLPGYVKAQAYCVMCHSAEYMLYQPPSAARPYWEAMVRRMKQVFAAPFDESEIPDLVDYLVKTYGDEQPR